MSPKDSSQRANWQGRLEVLGLARGVLEQRSRLVDVRALEACALGIDPWQIDAALMKALGELSLAAERLMRKAAAERVALESDEIRALWREAGLAVERAICVRDETRERALEIDTIVSPDLARAALGLVESAARFARAMESYVESEDVVGDPG
jgi:hypothetical protein